MLIDTQIACLLVPLAWYLAGNILFLFHPVAYSEQRQMQNVFQLWLSKNEAVTHIAILLLASLSFPAFIRTELSSIENTNDK